VSCHTALSVAFLPEFFGDRLISQLSWPPISRPSFPDFILWGRLKGHVYDNNPHSISNADYDTLRWVTRSVVKWKWGDQFEHLMQNCPCALTEHHTMKAY
jgi:hypothetical protein